MIGIRSRHVVIGVLRGPDAQPARHVQEVGHANLRARVAGALPLGNRRGLRELVGAVLDQDAHQRRRDALAHRPALERRARRDTGAVALGDEAPLPRHDERSGQGLRRIEGGIHRLPQFRLVEAGGERTSWQHVAHGPRLRGRVGQRARHRHGREIDGVALRRQRDASLAAQVLRRERRPLRHRHAHGLRGAIHHGLSHPGTLEVRPREVADVLSSELGIESRDEHRRAHHFGVSGRLVFERIARRRHVWGVELQRLRAGDEGLARGKRRLGRSGRGGRRRLRLAAPARGECRDKRHEGDACGSWPAVETSHRHLPGAAAPDMLPPR